MTRCMGDDASSRSGSPEPNSQETQGHAPLPARIRRALELVYSVEGVVAARVWHVPGSVSVGIRVGGFAAAPDVLRRVQSAVVALRDFDEQWDFGFLEGMD